MKNPSQSAMTTLISKCKNANKPLVVAGCVPQGSQGLKELEGISIIGVQQIDRVVEVVEETLKGHEVRLLSRKTLPSLDLPKVQVITVCIILCTKLVSCQYYEHFGVQFFCLICKLIPSSFSVLNRSCKFISDVQ